MLLDRSNSSTVVKRGYREREFAVEVDPKSMREVFALLFVSMGWNPEDNSQEIHKAVANWNPDGELAGNWQRKNLYQLQ